ncbi:MAG TPA: sialidase family protein [Blastocatellia bacterium]|nr:sialidase family protein [Blastocatellia bacterium]
MTRRSIISTFLLLIACTVNAQTHQHGSMADGDGQFNPFVTADPRGGFYLAYVERKGGANNVMLRHSSDGAKFSAPVRVNDRDGDATVRNENPPKVIAGAQGDVYVCWANERGKWKGNVRFARSTDGGKTFSAAMTINSDGAGEPAGHAFQSIAVDKQGRIYVAWIDERNKQKEDRGAEIWLSVSTDHGQTFSRDRRILSDVCECCRTSLQIDAAGNLYLTYRTVPRSGPMYRDIMLARSRDGGKTFAQTVVSYDKWEIDGCPVAGPSFSFDKKGGLTVVWFMGGGERPGLYYATSTDGGKSFSPRRPMDSSQQMGKHAHTALLSDGRLFVAWDYAANKASSAWGMLDTQKGLIEKSGDQSGVTYPVAAASGQVRVVAAMRSATHDIVTYTEAK